MKTETFKGTVESAYGKVLPTPVTFSGSYEHLQNASEVPTDEQLSPADILAVQNAKRKAAARAAATTAALSAAGIEKPDPNSEAVMIESMVKMTMKMKKVDEATARAAVMASLEAASV